MISLNAEEVVTGEFMIIHNNPELPEGRVETPWQSNKILRQLYERLTGIGRSGPLDVSLYSSGEPPSLDESRPALILASRGVPSATTVPDPEGIRQRLLTYTIELPLGSFQDGTVIRSVGLSDDVEHYSRGLVKDENGLPTEIPVNSLSSITVIYRVLYIPPKGFQTSTITLNDVVHTVTTRPVYSASHYSATSDRLDSFRTNARARGHRAFPPGFFTEEEFNSPTLSVPEGTVNVNFTTAGPRGGSAPYLGFRTGFRFPEEAFNMSGGIEWTLWGSRDQAFLSRFDPPINKEEGDVLILDYEVVLTLPED